MIQNMNIFHVSHRISYCYEIFLWKILECNSFLYTLSFFFYGTTAPSGAVPPNYRGFTITLRYIRLGRTLLEESSADAENLLDNTQHSQKTDIHAPYWIWTHVPSKRAAADPRLRRRGHCEWLREDIRMLKSGNRGTYVLGNIISGIHILKITLTIIHTFNYREHKISVKRRFPTRNINWRSRPKIVRNARRNHFGFERIYSLQHPCTKLQR